MFRRCLFPCVEAEVERPRSNVEVADEGGLCREEAVRSCQDQASVGQLKVEIWGDKQSPTSSGRDRATVAQELILSAPPMEHLRMSSDSARIEDCRPGVAGRKPHLQACRDFLAIPELGTASSSALYDGQEINRRSLKASSPSGPYAAVRYRRHSTGTHHGHSARSLPPPKHEEGGHTVVSPGSFRRSSAPDFTGVRQHLSGASGHLTRVAAPSRPWETLPGHVPHQDDSAQVLLSRRTASQPGISTTYSMEVPAGSACPSPLDRRMVKRHVTFKDGSEATSPTGASAAAAVANAVDGEQPSPAAAGEPSPTGHTCDPPRDLVLVDCAPIPCDSPCTTDSLLQSQEQGGAVDGEGCGPYSSLGSPCSAASSSKRSRVRRQRSHSTMSYAALEQMCRTDSHAPPGADTSTHGKAGTSQQGTRLTSTSLSSHLANAIRRSRRHSTGAALDAQPGSSIDRFMMSLGEALVTIDSRRAESGHLGTSGHIASAHSAAASGHIAYSTCPSGHSATTASGRFRVPSGVLTAASSVTSSHFAASGHLLGAGTARPSEGGTCRSEATASQTADGMPSRQAQQGRSSMQGVQGS